VEDSVFRAVMDKKKGTALGTDRMHQPIHARTIMNNYIPCPVGDPDLVQAFDPISPLHVAEGIMEDVCRGGIHLS